MNRVVNVPESGTTAAHLERPNGHVVVHTTLYDLIEAMHEVIAPHEDARVVQAIIHLFDTGRLAFCHAGAR
jgi:hypothetical protein